MRGGRPDDALPSNMSVGRHSCALRNGRQETPYTKTSIFSMNRPERGQNYGAVDRQPTCFPATVSFRVSCAGCRNGPKRPSALCMALPAGVLAPLSILYPVSHYGKQINLVVRRNCQPPHNVNLRVLFARSLDSLPLVYAGYGLIGGTGVGLAYTPPVQTLISWFPDKRGLASGLTIAG